MIAFNCPRCGSPMGTASALAGKITQCPTCRQEIIVPLASDPDCIHPGPSWYIPTEASKLNRPTPKCIAELFVFLQGKGEDELANDLLPRCGATRLADGRWGIAHTTPNIVLITIEAYTDRERQMWLDLAGGGFARFGFNPPSPAEKPQRVEHDSHGWWWYTEEPLPEADRSALRVQVHDGPCSARLAFRFVAKVLPGVTDCGVVVDDGNGHLWTTDERRFLEARSLAAIKALLDAR